MAYKSRLLLAVVGCIALAAAGSAETTEDTILLRQVRSPQGGSVNLEYSQSEAGKRAGVEYNHNLHTSSDGRLKVDAYGQAQRDFTHNRNDYGGGVRGSWNF